MTAPLPTLAAVLDDRNIVTVDNFLSPSVRERMLIEISEGEWTSSGVAPKADAARTLVSSGTGRSSSTLVLTHPNRWMKGALRRIERSLLDAFGIEPGNLEPWQATLYKRGQAYDYHLDCGGWRGDASGERRRTILIYLEQPVRGGATDFRALHRRIPPVAGRLVVWNNLLANGNCNHAMIHSGRPVWQGRKTILTTWEREGRFFRQRK